MRMNNLGKIPMTLLATLLLAACNPFNQPASMMDEYSERLERVLDEPMVQSPVPTVEAMPRRRERVLEIPELDMGLVDFLSLYGCELQVVVGERSSSLGRVMHPGTRLEYEVRFISAAERCLPDIDNERRAEMVQEAADAKVEHLPIAIWNATWGSDELAKLFSRSQGALPRDMPYQSLSEASRSVVTMVNILEGLHNGTHPRELEPLHGIYQRWQSDATAGKLLRSAELMAIRLDDAARLIENRLEREPVCRNGEISRTGEIADGLFNAVYLEEVQPYMADLQRARFELLPPLQTLLETQQEQMPDHMAAFARRNLTEAEGSVWLALDRATQRHSQAWQELLQQCGLRPSPEEAAKDAS
ncbi:MAG: DUF3080 domain-containing protein [Halomonadaceae bacterium]|nr:MAG: DUF3080 domain-containing protein [Halomonadaceae bacterium]